MEGFRGHRTCTELIQSLFHLSRGFDRERDGDAAAGIPLPARTAEGDAAGDGPSLASTGHRRDPDGAFESARGPLLGIVEALQKGHLIIRHTPIVAKISTSHVLVWKCDET